MRLAVSRKETRRTQRRQNMSYRVSFISLCVLFLLTAITAPMLEAESKDPADYPLRIHVISHNEATHYHNGVAESSAGEGRANLFENSEASGVDFAFNCLPAPRASSGFETFPARWKKPNRELVVLLPEIGKANHYSTCNFKVEMKDFAYYRTQNGLLSTEPKAAFKDWMTQHSYDPEHGKDVPMQAKSSIPAFALESKDPADYALRIHIYSHTETNFFHDGVYQRSKGEGRANLFENGEPAGLDFVFECPVKPRASSGFETFRAKWKTPGQELVVLIPEVGKAGQYSTCQFGVEVKRFAYNRQATGTLAAVPCDF